MRSVDEIIAGRELIMAVDVLACFEAATGRSISPNTLAAWRVMDPLGVWAVQPPGQRYWVYDWPQLWTWYRTYTATQKQNRRRKSV